MVYPRITKSRRDWMQSRLETEGSLTKPMTVADFETVRRPFVDAKLAGGNYFAFKAKFERQLGHEPTGNEMTFLQNVKGKVITIADFCGTFPRADGCDAEKAKQEGVDKARETGKDTSKHRYNPSRKKKSSKRSEVDIDYDVPEVRRIDKRLEAGWHKERDAEGHAYWQHESGVSQWQKPKDIRSGLPPKIGDGQRKRWWVGGKSNGRIFYSRQKWDGNLWQFDTTKPSVFADDLAGPERPREIISTCLQSFPRGVAVDASEAKAYKPMNDADIAHFIAEIEAEVLEEEFGTPDQKKLRKMTTKLFELFAGLPQDPSEKQMVFARVCAGDLISILKRLTDADWNEVARSSDITVEKLHQLNVFDETLLYKSYSLEDFFGTGRNSDDLGIFRIDAVIYKICKILQIPII
eukprot:gnl/MRDRNA2_/MRDRNA2_25006_c0_seq1.p1 gnl/MRDRNA2_/MRDRNA2_25006_c0~~gnl/MRDRNA2_/MRDRNA2_25006_c0_seq1.p1  ORF type:complete len:432 (+),score=63.15 gnl/MRDRNA2_/MRDRNA2_25006_c0_seq1:74-1297(+)